MSRQLLLNPRCLFLGVLTLLLCLRSCESIEIRGGHPSVSYTKLRCIPADLPDSHEISIDVSMINDDYCDCLNGMDEPGTAACGEGQFYCRNQGARATMVPASWVDDGRCDCCDGSDEKSGCEDRCEEEGRVMREQVEGKVKMILKGVSIREKYAKEGEKLMMEERESLKRLEKKLVIVEEEIKQRKEHVEKLKRAEERLEALKVRTPDEGKKEKVEEDESEDDVSEDDEAMDDVNNDEDDKAEDGDSNPGEKQEAETNLDKNKESDNIGEQFRQELSENKDAGSLINDRNDSSEKIEESSNDFVCPSIDESMYGQARYYFKYAKSQLGRIVGFKVSTGDDVSNLSSCLDDARALLDKAEEKQRNIKTESDEMRKRVERDYGSPGLALRKLDGECFKKTFTQYDFEHCFFDEVRQYEHGSVIARLGKWKRWDGDDMLYRGGDKCWNGPSRSIKVILECGDSEEILTVDESQRCVYSMRFTTPAVCEKAAADKLKASLSTESDVKDEL
eukprot:Plantae.Rhodophyta-Hildenbrandia_rubra.ctg4464.p1 GENE.Plantae.Rhodophyta-Hildenbrandia_rubra.ctg4464~~Plantae.Rhodophyta-Hildenbrandia_rubra.ctg4464.p1  ORF type:complete len:507 (-),score=114.20 Plantae.Rhodophyta-Hildenbrandia_rubra.ctg4464:755-2275(-)